MLKRTIRKLARPRILRVLFFCAILIFSSLGYAVYLNYTEKAENAYWKQVEARQIVLARAGARSIEVFLNYVSNDIRHIGILLENVPLQEQQVRGIFREFLNSHKKEPVVAIRKYDNKGVLKIVENFELNRSDEGQDYSDRDYIIWASDPDNRSKVYISEPFIARSSVRGGQSLFVIATPLYRRDLFDGVLLAAVTMDDFDKYFIKPLKINNQNSAMLINHDGILYEGRKDLINKNLIDYAKEKAWQGYEDYIEKLSEKVLREEEGKGRWNDVYPHSDNGERLYAFHAIESNNARWVLVIFGLTDTFNQPLVRLDQVGALWVMVIALATVTVSCLFILMEHTIHEVGYQKGTLRGIIIAVESARGHLGKKKGENVKGADRMA